MPLAEPTYGSDNVGLVWGYLFAPGCAGHQIGSDDLPDRLGPPSGSESKEFVWLTLVTVLALPMTIIPGLLGMNIGGVPLRDHPGGFWLVVMLTLLISALGGWFAFGHHRDS